MTTFLDQRSNTLLYSTENKNKNSRILCRGVFSGAAIIAPPSALHHLRENTRSRRQGRRHDPLGRKIGGLDHQRANGSQDNADDHDEEMIVAVVLCLCVMAAATTAVDAAVTGLQETRREAPGDYRRPNLSYLHNHAEDVSLFKRKYRMERTSFNKLVRLLTPYLERDEHFAVLGSPAGAISVELRVAMSLSYLAGSFYLDLALLYGVCRASVYNAIWSVVDAVCACAAVGLFKFPRNAGDCAKLSADWKDVGNGFFSHLIGAAAVDGLLVRCEAPSSRDAKNPIRFYSYSGSKRAYGYNVQGLCDRNYRFLSFCANSPGATNDSVAWKKSKMSKLVEKLPKGFYIVWDNAYTNTEHLLTPYAGKNQITSKDTFNFPLSQSRIHIEQAFGILVARWGILWRPLRMGYKKRTLVVRALFHLHNFCIDEKVSSTVAGEEAVKGRPAFSNEGVLEPEWETEQGENVTFDRDTTIRTAFALKASREGLRRPRANSVRNLNT